MRIAAFELRSQECHELTLASHTRIADEQPHGGHQLSGRLWLSRLNKSRHRVRHIRLFQFHDLFMRQLKRQGGHRILQMLGL